MQNIPNYLKRWINPFKMEQSIKDEFVITEGRPFPIKGVEYREVLRIRKTLEDLPVNGSFPIRSELARAVRKVANDHFPEYKIVIRDFGNGHRVFRIA